ncbi:MAG: hypothetical protein PVJ27_02200 [Candidatus Brocadiaceae bacterium]|jgi:hypothetical protein
MDDAISEAFSKEAPQPSEVADLYRDLPDVIDLGAGVTCDRGPLFRDARCHTAFSMVFSSGNEKWSLVAEFPKMSRFAKTCWLRHRLLAAHY